MQDAGQRPPVFGWDGWLIQTLQPGKTVATCVIVSDDLNPVDSDALGSERVRVGFGIAVDHLVPAEGEGVLEQRLRRRAPKVQIRPAGRWELVVSQVRGDVEDGQAEAGSTCADGPVDNPLADTAALDGTGVEGVAARRAQVERESARKTPIILHAKSPKHADPLLKAILLII